MNVIVENRMKVVSEEVKTLIIETTMSEMIMNLINGAKDVIQDNINEFEPDELCLVDTMFDVIAQTREMFILASKTGSELCTITLWNNIKDMLKEGMVTSFILPDHIRELVENEYDDDFILTIKNNMGHGTLVFPGKDIMW